jgi:hypothetical protein
MRRGALAATTIVLALLIAGCSHDSKSASSASVDGGAGQGPTATSGEAAAGNAAPGKDAARPPGAAAGTAGAGTAGKATTASVPLTDRAVIRTANISVQTTDVSARADRAIQIAMGVGGEVLGDVRSDGTGSSATADVTLAVPPGSLEAVLGQLAALGKELSRQTTTQDVTTQVADVSSRVSSARASIARLQALYGKANTIGDVIAVEGELSQREADLESLEAQQRSLTAQTAQASVAVHLQGTDAVAPAHKAHSTPGGGFTAGLGHGWRAFVSAVGATLTVLGTVLPFAVLLGLVGGAIAAVRRRIKRAAPVGSTE